ncbi:MAG: hypothetical protein CMP62_01180 [Flavobacteriales bacterium]|nr:hypothetical protein [Flavobacteriales bacterium]
MNSNLQARSKKYIIALYIFLLTINGCGVYSFSGASIPDEAKTIYIHYIKNEATLIEPNLSNKLTESLKTKCLTESNLVWGDQKSEINFSGRIKKYEVSPMAIENNETAAKNRLTISVEVTYNNQFDPTQNFNTVFTDYADFDSDENFYAKEEELNDIIINNLIEDIFNAAFLNW